VVNVFGASSDGRWAYGLVLAAPGTGAKSTCLAKLDPLAMLRVVGQQCGVPEVGEWGSVSPDGKLLAYQHPHAPTAQTVVVDPGSVFGDPRIVATWPSGTEGVWIDETMLVQGDDARIYRYRVGRDAEPLTLPGQPSGVPVEPVPVLS
jgi:hypothetical protein